VGLRRLTAQRRARMEMHANAKLGLAGRFSLVQAIETGASMRQAARRHGVSPATACKWWHRWREASSSERSSFACLRDRSSRPKRSPRMLAKTEQQRICAARRRSGWGPRLIAGETGHAHATVHRALRRAGISRQPQSPERRASATSGLARETSYTWTRSASPASQGPVTQ